EPKNQQHFQEVPLINTLPEPNNQQHFQEVPLIN
ncbi:unnamed protein product, partial [Allacma fusca]